MLLLGHYSNNSAILWKPVLFFIGWLYPVLSHLIFSAFFLLTLKNQYRNRITEWIGLEGTLKITSPTPCFGQDNLSLDEAALSPSNLSLNPSRDGAPTISLGSRCQCLITLSVKNFFLITSLNKLFFLIIIF